MFDLLELRDIVGISIVVFLVFLLYKTLKRKNGSSIRENNSSGEGW